MDMLNRPVLDGISPTVVPVSGADMPLWCGESLIKTEKAVVAMKSPSKQSPEDETRREREEVCSTSKADSSCYESLSESEPEDEPKQSAAAGSKGKYQGFH